MSRIRVIIVAWKNDADLARCLPAVAGAPDAETVVVDNASSPATAGLLARDFPDVKYVDPGENLGFARANNRGAKGFSGEHLCFLNPDTEVDPGALGGLADFLDAHPQAGAAGPLVRNTDGSRQMSCRRWPGFLTPLFHRYSLLTRLWPDNPWSRAYLMSDGGDEEARRVDWLSACCLMVRRRAFAAVGGFDERYFMFCEDTALCRTLSLAGWERWFVPGAAITHHIGHSLREGSVALVWQRHRSMWIYFRTFSAHPRLLAPAVFAGLSLRFALYALRALVTR